MDADEPGLGSAPSPAQLHVRCEPIVQMRKRRRRAGLTCPRPHSWGLNVTLGRAWILSRFILLPPIKLNSVLYLLFWMAVTFLVPNSGTQLDAPSLAPQELPALEMRRLAAESSPSCRWDAMAHPSSPSLCGSCDSAGPSGLQNGLPTLSQPPEQSIHSRPGAVSGRATGQESWRIRVLLATLGERTSRVWPQQAARYTRGDATVM